MWRYLLMRKMKRRSVTSQSPQKVSTVGTVAGRTNTQVCAGAHRLSVLGWTPPRRARAPLGFLRGGGTGCRREEKDTDSHSASEQGGGLQECGRSG